MLSLTRREQTLIALVMGAFLVGAGVKLWRGQLVRQEVAATDKR
jgi:hypothetical protein